MADSLDGTHDFSLYTERVWDIIGLQIDRFTAAWDQGVPILADYLPRANDELRQITITELVKIDL
ncbi:MAG: hypothetical protein KDA60_10335, partial [Planctomycetales bacterium]|nr:hypothetical protein [Planctomycetales bacterium]